MKYLSVCSGIEAASVAWGPLGMEAVAFAEIDEFCSALLEQRFPGVPNWGDLTKHKEWPDAEFDVLVGGTPCQSFSVAGQRGGLADARGQLALGFLGALARYRPRWVVWENVPGVLSSGRGRDLGAFLGALGELGYGWAYRVLDAQHFGVPQRRRRVFVVGCLGDWRGPTAVLLERPGLRRHPPSREEAGEGVARPLASCALGGSGYRADADTAENLVTGAVSAKWAKGTDGPAGDECYNLVAGTLCGGGSTPAARGKQSGEAVPMVAVNVLRIHCDCGCWFEGLINTPCPGCGMFAGGEVTHLQPEVADPLCANEQRTYLMQDLRASSEGTGVLRQALSAVQDARGSLCGEGEPTHSGAAIRRLVPEETEALQGFPRGWTLIRWGKGLAPDSRRYRAIGNSMAVPVMRWIGERLLAVDALVTERDR